MDQFILFGDSLTQHSSAGDGRAFNFGATLTNAYVRKLDVVNRGFSGYNSSQALHVLPQVLPSPRKARIRFCIVFFGANDSRLPDTPGGPDQCVPLPQYKENLRSIVMHPWLRAHLDARLILVTPPPIDERKLLDHDSKKHPQLASMLRRTATNTARYAEAVREVGAELKVPVLDIWTAMIRRACEIDLTPAKANPGLLPGSIDASPNAVLDRYLHDGLHFSSHGYEVLYDELMAVIQSRWPGQMPDELPRVLPDWDDVEQWKRRDVDAGIVQR